MFEAMLLTWGCHQEGMVSGRLPSSLSQGSKHSSCKAQCLSSWCRRSWWSL